jgi:type I restriction enzyme S subunit
MTPHDLLAAFETLAEAPDGIARLRELVLQLAVRGMLVPQDPDDEPACMLLKRIDAEKARLVKEGKIPTRKLLPTVDEDEVPFVVPKGWVWVRLGTIALNIHYGYTASANHQKRDVLLLRITDIQNNTVNWLSVPGCNIDEDQVEKYRLNDGDIVVARTGGTVGKTYQVSGLIGLIAIFASYLIRVKNPAAIDSTYLKYSMGTPLYWSQLLSMAAGTGQPNVNATSLSELLLPLPPLPEQYRIVAKVDTLMALLDNMEAARSEREIIRAALRDAALAALRDAPDVEAVEAAWTRIAEHIDDVFIDPADMAPLRQTILQLAVQGKLVPQNPDDEPACLLLERITAEKMRPVNNGRIPKSKPLFPVVEDEILFDLPKGWVWCRIDDCFEVVGGIQKSGKRQPEQNTFPYLRVANVQRGQLNLGEIHKFELFEGELDRWRLNAGDVLVVEGNGSEEEIGRCARWNGEIADCVHQNHLIRCRPLVPSIEHFVLRYLNSPVGMETMKVLSVTTSGLYNLSVSKIKNISFPLPPLLEQHRIVAKVDALMALCDALEARLTAAREAQTAFAAAAVHHLDV